MNEDCIIQLHSFGHKLNIIWPNIWTELESLTHLCVRHAAKNKHVFTQITYFVRKYSNNRVILKIHKQNDAQNTITSFQASAIKTTPKSLVYRTFRP
jgi:hypothetical protein